MNVYETGRNGASILVWSLSPVGDRHGRLVERDKDSRTEV